MCLHLYQTEEILFIGQYGILSPQILNLEIRYLLPQTFYGFPDLIEESDSNSGIEKIKSVILDDLNQITI